ncbi:ATP-binding protein [Streptomyces sp. NPDC004082]|uniref:ATP-binding protein n=1 Tax=unclassified Streptomyces TaxID=2593676 RepID=UPI0033AC6148
MTAPGAHPRRPSPSPTHGAHAPDDHVPFRRVRHHEALIELTQPRPLRTAVPAHPSQAACVRRTITTHLAGLPLPAETVDDAVLAADEVFANAVRHGSAGTADLITVTVECTGRHLRVTVADSSPTAPSARPRDVTAESGRGLAIVAALADDWGVAPPEPGGHGKRVWFTLALGPGEAS